MNISSFHNMNLNKYKNILDNLVIKKDIDYYEKKYQVLISKYSDAYLEGSKWYVGKSFKNYAINKSINNLYDPDIEYIIYILDNYKI